MHILALIGGIGSGKSEVARRLAARGAEILDADRIGHELLQDDSIKRILRERWGDSIFSCDGSVDRSRIAKVVFAPDEKGKQELRFLENLLHPRIMEEIRRRIGRPNASIFVLDAPLLFEACWNVIPSKIVFVETSEQTRRTRTAKRGWTAEELRRRENAQWSLAEKRAKADCCISNDGTLEELDDEIDRLWTSCGFPASQG